jgi:hypothetical protein
MRTVLRRRSRQRNVSAAARRIACLHLAQCMFRFARCTLQVPHNASHRPGAWCSVQGAGLHARVHQHVRRRSARVPLQVRRVPEMGRVPALVMCARRARAYHRRGDRAQFRVLNEHRGIARTTAQTEGRRIKRSCRYSRSSPTALQLLASAPRILEYSTANSARRDRRLVLATRWYAHHMYTQVLKEPRGTRVGTRLAEHGV